MILARTIERQPTSSKIPIPNQQIYYVTKRAGPSGLGQRADFEDQAQAKALQDGDDLEQPVWKSVSTG